MLFQTISPATGQTLKTFDELSDQEVQVKIEKAVKCFETWKRTSYVDRAEVISKVADLMRAKKLRLWSRTRKYGHSRICE